MRAEGDTTKKILRALYHALSESGACVLFVHGTKPSMDRALRISCDMLHVSVPDFFNLEKGARQINLNNGSVIKFVSTDYVRDGRWKGLRLTSFVEDGSVENFINTDEYSYMSREAFYATERELSRRKK